MISIQQEVFFYNKMKYFFHSYLISCLVNLVSGAKIDSVGIGLTSRGLDEPRISEAKESGLIQTANELFYLQSPLNFTAANVPYNNRHGPFFKF